MAKSPAIRKPAVEERTEKKVRDEAFGQRIKRLRREANLTLQQLSERSGLAISTISKVENSQISPTYENILRLADGLEVDVADLFARGSSAMALGRRSITRAGQGAKLQSTQYQYEMLCADLSKKKFIPLLTKLRAHSVAEFPDLVRHAGEEFVYVVEGDVAIHTDHYEPLLLKQGDACYFDSNMGHALVSVGKTDAVVMWICSTLINNPEAKPLQMVANTRKKKDG
jgi:transcriptional regulator with XRE-family HTH domain